MVSGNDEGWGETGGTCIDGCAGGSKDFDWILEIQDELNSNYGLNDVVSGDEVTSANPKPNLLDEEDDDCIILEGDPEKLTVAETVSTGDGNSDEVEVVGTKGEIACRDFPHARHLCANYIFASTPHENHCHLCHCYVCDSPAPCIHWGTGMLVLDHCHATDKEDYWKRERNRIKNGDNAATTTSSILTDINIHPHLNPQPQPNQAPQASGLVLQQPHHHLAIQNRIGHKAPLHQVNYGAIQPNLHHQNILHQVYGGGSSFKRLGRAGFPLNHQYVHQSSHNPSAMGARTQISQSVQHRGPSLPNTGQSYFLIPPHQSQLNTAAPITHQRILNQRTFSPQLLGENLATLVPSFQQNTADLGFLYSQDNHQVMTSWNGNGLENHLGCESSSAASAIPLNNHHLQGFESNIYHQVDPLLANIVNTVPFRYEIDPLTLRQLVATTRANPGLNVCSPEGGLPLGSTVRFSDI